ncbi:MAG: tetratricopeptide repeat protein [Alphaproteobacteria bacterium]|nr:tetratricopeptide repeat protein [Alphaproteobacteria bacterium]
MNNQQEALRVLRRAGESRDDAVNLGDAALALALLDTKKDADLTPYRARLASLVDQLKAQGDAKKLDDQLTILRRVLVIHNKFQGDDNHNDDARANNLMDVLDRKAGSPVALGLLYLHLASEMGWAMTGLDLSGHFLLRLSAQDGQVIIDPFRAGQTCQIEEVGDYLLDDDELLEEQERPTPLDLSSELLHPLSKRDVLLRLQHAVKRQHLSQDRVEAAIATLQSMILFAPRHQDLWRELGYLQAERGHLRAAITALEVVRDLVVDPAPLQQTDVLLRELRWRLN